MGFQRWQACQCIQRSRFVVTNSVRNSSSSACGVTAMPVSLMPMRCGAVFPAATAEEVPSALVSGRVCPDAFLRFTP